MTDPVSLQRADGHRARLKWHKLCLSTDDTPFSMERFDRAMACGASCEIDLQVLPDGTWVILHDFELDRETTGTGPVRDLTGTVVADLSMRSPASRTPDEPVRLLDDFTRRLAVAAPAPGFALQLDLKAPAAHLDDAAVASFCDAVRPVANHCLVSGFEWPAIRRLVDACGSELACGFDPLRMLPPNANGDAGADSIDPRRFVDDVLAAAPEATWLYFHHRLIADLARRDVDVVAIARAAGKKTDAWTIDPGDVTAEQALDLVMALGVDQITTNAAPAWSRWWGGRMLQSAQ